MVNVHSEIEPRFNMLLTADRPHSESHWTRQLPRLLRPQGVAAYVAHSAREAVDLAEHRRIHAAVIDMGTPAEPDEQGSEDAAPGITAPGITAPAPGLPSRPTRGPVDYEMWLLELLRRLPNSPPVVIVRKPAFTQQQAVRTLSRALRLGVFSVLNKPVSVEQLLDVFQRLMDSRYEGAWPGGRLSKHPADQPPDPDPDSSDH